MTTGHDDGTTFKVLFWHQNRWIAYTDYTSHLAAMRDARSLLELFSHVELHSFAPDVSPSAVAVEIDRFAQEAPQR
jgi:hypothetical protein